MPLVAALRLCPAESVSEPEPLSLSQAFNRWPDELSTGPSATISVDVNPIRLDLTLYTPMIYMNVYWFSVI